MTNPELSDPRPFRVFIPVTRKSLFPEETGPDTESTSGWIHTRTLPTRRAGEASWRRGSRLAWAHRPPSRSRAGLCMGAAPPHGSPQRVSVPMEPGRKKELPALLPQARRSPACCPCTPSVRWSRGWSPRSLLTVTAGSEGGGRVLHAPCYTGFSAVWFCTSVHFFSN